MASAGDLRERITIQTAAAVTNAGGGRTNPWSTLATTWARVQPVKGGENEDAGRLAGLQTYLVTIRDRTISLSNRIVWRGKTLNIRSITNRDERQHWLTMECEEGVQNG